MPDTDLERILRRWTQDHEIRLLDEGGGSDRKFFYVSSPRGETYQVVIEPERHGVVRVDAHLIETWEEEERHSVWETPRERVVETLDLCFQAIQDWFHR